MAKNLTLLFDLDGTILDSLHEKYNKYRVGISDFNINEIVICEGTIELIQKLKVDGH